MLRERNRGRETDKERAMTTAKGLTFINQQFPEQEVRVGVYVCMCVFDKLSF